MPRTYERAPLSERLWRHVRKTETCWLWTGGTNKPGALGYGSIGDPNGGRVYAHRLSWELANGRKVPKGMDVMHACDNRICVNPAHLSVGTRKQNLADMRKRGRAAPSPFADPQLRELANAKRVLPRGGEKMNAVLHDQKDVIAIEALLAKGTSQDAIARQFGVSQTVVSLIKRGLFWNCPGHATTGKSRQFGTSK